MFEIFQKLPMRASTIFMVINLHFAGASFAQDAATNAANILLNSADISSNSASISSNSASISANSNNISGNTADINTLETNLESEIAETDSDFASLRVHSDRQDSLTLERAQEFASGLTAMSIASASSINSINGDFKLGFGIGYGEVNGEDAFALGFVSQSENEKIKMSFNIGINEHVDTSLGVGIFFKLR